MTEALADGVPGAAVFRARRPSSRSCAGARWCTHPVPPVRALLRMNPVCPLASVKTCADGRALDHGRTRTIGVTWTALTIFFAAIPLSTSRSRSASSFFSRLFSVRAASAASIRRTHRSETPPPDVQRLLAKAVLLRHLRHRGLVRLPQEVCTIYSSVNLLLRMPLRRLREGHALTLQLVRNSPSRSLSLAAKHPTRRRALEGRKTAPAIDCGTGSWSPRNGS